MTEPDATANLTYTLATSPGGLFCTTAGHPRQGRLEITAGSADGQRPTSCRSITVTVPTGLAGAALTHHPERIDTAYSAPGTWFVERNFADPDAAVFTFRPSNRRHEALLDDTAGLVLILDRIPLAARSGDVELRITDETATGPGAQDYVVGETTVSVTISPAPPQDT